MTPNAPDEARDAGPAGPAAVGTGAAPCRRPIPDEGELIARALVRLRGDRSRAEVARAAGVDEAAWEHYESGRRSFTPEQRVPLARGLGVTVYELEHTLWRERAAELRKLEGGAPEPSESDLQLGRRLSKRLQLKAAVARIAEGVNTLIDDYCDTLHQSSR